MGTITAQSIIDDVRATLFDLKVTKRWSDDELLGYLNKGCKEAAKLNPEVNPVTTVVDIAPGVKQTVPPEYYSFIRLTRNMGVDGATPGQVILPTEPNELTAYDVNWMAGSEVTGIVDNFIGAKPDRRTFYTYPGLNAVTQAEGVFVEIPVDILIAAAIPLEDVWALTLRYFVLGRALEVDASKGDPGRSGHYMNLFYQSLGLGGDSA